MIATDEREALRETARRFLADVDASAGARAMMDDPVGFSRDVYAAMATMGWTGLTIPEAYGGAGSSFAGLAVVLEEIGRYLTPSPFFSTAVLATEALLAAGTDEQKTAYLPELASGRIRGTLAATGPNGGAPAAEIEVRLSRRGRSCRLDGVASFVPDAHVSDLLVVAAKDDHSIHLAVLEADSRSIQVDVVPTVDQTRRLCKVTFDGAFIADSAILAARDGAGTLGLLLDRAAAGIAADSLGGARRAMELAVEHAKQRLQFGRPIGSFQAIKHRCADMVLLMEGARSAVDRAVDAATLATLESSLWASIAKSYATDAYARIAGDGIQVHGGIGFTWEYNAHLYLKRAKLNQALYGDPGWHRQRIGHRLLHTTTE